LTKRILKDFGFGWFCTRQEAHLGWQKTLGKLCQRINHNKVSNAFGTISLEPWIDSTNVFFNGFGQPFVINGGLIAIQELSH